MTLVIGTAVLSARMLAVGRDHLLVPVERVLRDALLGLVVDVDQAEALLVAVGPLEVVEQRPGVVAGHRHAVLDRARELEQVAVHEVDALRIVDLAVQEHLIAHRQAVLGDRQRQLVAVVEEARPPVHATPGVIVCQSEPARG